MFNIEGYDKTTVMTAPLRVSFVGGGTDQPQHYRNYGGAVLSLAIDKVARVSIRSDTRGGSMTNVCEDPAAPKTIGPTPIVEYLRLKGQLKTERLHCTLQIPPGTGLGTSSATAVAVIAALNRHRGNELTVSELAEAAWKTEMAASGDGIGKQDHYIAAYGGLRVFQFAPDDQVSVSPNRLERPDLSLALARHCFLVKVGGTRDSGAALVEQGRRAANNSVHLAELASLVPALEREFTSNQVDWRAVGAIVTAGWKIKRVLAPHISNSIVDLLLSNLAVVGCYGSKLLGAGACGYVLVIGDELARERVQSIVGVERTVSIVPRDFGVLEERAH